MNNTEPVTPIEEKKKGGKRSTILMIVLLAIIVGLSTYFILHLNSNNELLTQQKVEKEQQRLALEEELQSLTLAHNEIKVNYGTLSDSLESKDVVIMENAKEIKRLLNTEWEYYKIKKKLDKLREITQGYLTQMDSLYNVNEILIEENSEMKAEIERTNQRVSEVEQEKIKAEEKIAEAAIFNVHDVNAYAYRLKGNKRAKTEKAKKVYGFEVSFTLSGNTLIEHGSKTLYARISDPEQNVLFRGDGEEYTFELDGKTIYYSLKKEVNYSGEEVSETMVWSKVLNSQRYTPGRYAIDLYCGKQLLFSRSVMIK